MYIVVDRALCVGCGDCLSICPAGAIALQEGKAEICAKCVRCGACVSECLRQAIMLNKLQV